MSRLFRVCAAAAATLAFTGCASIVSGTNQSLSVTTRNGANDVSGAKCSLLNDKGVWYLTTPGSVTVRRSFGELAVNCALDGAEPGVAMVKSSTKPMAFGNILFGGVIGAGVDMANGAAYDYPELIVVTLGQVSTVQQPNAAAGAVPSGSAATATATATPPVSAATASNGGGSTGAPAVVRCNPNSNAPRCPP